ncbi:ParA family protein [Coralloluteibacterium stylophorae]|uniref:ParA family protein n=1 Tax=Coralloluteibacterium stylophorae TaxID=1776034 RepID=A0A8J7VRG9_9GAMM|nr:ParA family protein [Coralloluteibacterium stylophorae]MBS7457376.1 ParA family protein [Coralloluteibacterium stylophorae]
MRTILVASSKGGAGKTTLATHLAGHAALHGRKSVLVDADPQGSSQRWCERRAGLESAVLPVPAVRGRWPKQVPADADQVVVDGAAGAFAGDLEGVLERADAVVVPVLPSMIDVEATVPFLDSLAAHPRVRSGQLPVGLVANRLRPHTRASQDALGWLAQWPYPVVAELRDSQAYVLLVGLGRTLFDYHSEAVRGHQADWAPLLRWLQRARG